MKSTALLLLLLAFAAQTSAVDIIAHRGASHDAPENTLASFKLGWQQRADACELDIWLSKDGRLIVSHDENTRRTTGVAKKISESTLAELRALDAGSWKDPKWKGEPLPTLEEVLALIPDGRRLVIEIKCGVECLPALGRVLTASGKPAAQLVIISFHYDVCAEAKKLFPKIPVLFLASFKQDKASGKWSPTPDTLIAKATRAGLDGLNLSSKGPLDAAFVKQTHAAGLKFYVWTVDDAAVARQLVAAGVDGITTNRPEWLREQLSRDAN
jgi:glycerophosphoryl diester phosphodiesterase